MNDSYPYGAFAVEEPLALSAPLARGIAERECARHDKSTLGCVWYHGPWQYFRALGVVTTLRTHGGFFLRTFRDLASGGRSRRVLVSGSADYTMLAHLAAAYRSVGAPLDVTVVDRCSTPLRLNVWYAARYGIRVRTQQSDIMAFRAERPFDLICTHSFLGRFDPAGRRRLLVHWRGLLRPGGTVVTAQRVRPGYADELVHSEPDEVERFRRRAERRAREAAGDLGVDPGEIATWAETYARTKLSHPIRSIGEIREVFTDASFSLEHLESGGEAEHRRDRPAGALTKGSRRYRIIASRQG